MTMIVLAYVLFVALLLLLIGLLRYDPVEKWRNARQPELSLTAHVIGKRTTIGSGIGYNTISTRYFITFESSDGIRREISVSGAEYGLLFEGDSGVLRVQGSQYKGFERQRVAQI